MKITKEGWKEMVGSMPDMSLADLHMRDILGTTAPGPKKASLAENPKNHDFGKYEVIDDLC